MAITGQVIRYGDNVDTDVIIPARYLNTTDHQELAAHCMEDLDATFISRVKQGDIMAAGSNFGCGSSREHAPWVFEVNGVHTIIAQSYARIFRQNTFNGGMLAIELPKADLDRLFALDKAGEVTISVDLDAQKVTAKAGDKTETFSFEISPFDKALVQAGGWVEFADARY